MRFNILSAVCLVSSVVAVPTTLAAHDISVLDDAMRRVSGAMQNLDFALRSLTPYRDVSEADAQATWVLQYSRVLIDELNFGARGVRMGPAINTIEALSLPQKTSTMFKQLQGVIASVRGVRPTIQAAGKKPWVLDELMKSSDAMASFFDAVMSRLGPVEAGLTAATKQQFLGAFGVAIREYRR